jgi:predicted nucleotide-binding protein
VEIKSTAPALNARGATISGTMIAMTPRRPRNSPKQPERPEPSVLRLPLSDAEGQLTARIEAGRELVDADAAALDAQLASMPYARHMYSPGARPPGEQLVYALGRKVGQWRDYNQTWLNRNLAGEAAQEYQSASKHWNFGGADDPRVDLRWLRENVESEISKLESIRERLPMWQEPESAAAAMTEIISRGNEGGAPEVASNTKLVMVIYGHDAGADTALFDWLRAIGLEPQEWSQIILATGNASPYIGQALEQAFRDAQAVVAFFTPDERVLARNASLEDPGAWRFQARPNVLIEAGMALTTHPDRTVLVVLGDQALPSDLAGRHYIRLNRMSAVPLHDLANRLKQAGCDTDTTGSAWLDPGRFPDRNFEPAPTPEG